MNNLGLCDRLHRLIGSSAALSTGARLVFILDRKVLLTVGPRILRPGRSVKTDTDGIDSSCEVQGPGVTTKEQFCAV